MLKQLLQDFYAPIDLEKQRIFFIDFLRFIAIVLMVIFHFTYDLNMLGFLKVNFKSGFWFYLPRFIVILFLASSALSLNRENKKRSIFENFSKIKVRFMKLSFYAFLVSLVTYFIFPKNWVYFGTLHCLAALSLVSTLFLGRPKLSFFLGLMVLVNFFTDLIEIKDFFHFVKIQSVDYIPFYPWVGVFLVFFAPAAFVKFKKYSPKLEFKFISIVSQKSLVIYLVHQPLIFGTLYLIKTFF